MARMNRVLAHIDQHLDQPLDLPTLAAVAHFSPFHFHRLFAAWMGERLGDHVRRRRLQVGAKLLLTQPRSTVLAVALTVGFGSAEAFARAFRQHFGCTPSQWRTQRQRKRDQVAMTDVGDDGGTFIPRFETMPMTVTVTDLPAATLACLRHIGPYGPTVAHFWQTRFDPWLDANGLQDAVLYGISHDDPTIADPATCRFDAGAEVAADFAVGHGAYRVTLPGGRYAVLPFIGRPETIGEAWQSLMRDWLSQSGWQLDARPCFERYPPGGGLDQATGTLICDICIPITPL
jgi:AraC family transcriptional regulator